MYFVTARFFHFFSLFADFVREQKIVIWLTGLKPVNKFWFLFGA